MQKFLYLYVIGKVLVMERCLIKVSGSLDGLQEQLAGKKRVIAVVDRKVGELYHSVIPVTERIFIDASEDGKTLQTVSYIVGRLLDMEADRNIFLLGIGGGITTDITGFVASVYKRGVRFGFVPTTLLAQVDASIGGKNGVNYNGLKNIIGSFSLPDFTWSSSSFLKSLSRREMLNGIAELLKTFIIGDSDAYAELIGILRSHSGKVDWPLYIKRASEIKKNIVDSDFQDTGERMKLNLGHTFGHAIEKCAAAQRIDISHGEAVAVGIIMAAGLSEKLGYALKGTVAGLETQFRAIGLPTKSPFGIAELFVALRNDKKRDGDSINFVLICGIGDVIVKSLRMEDISL